MFIASKNIPSRMMVVVNLSPAYSHDNKVGRLGLLIFGVGILPLIILEANLFCVVRRKSTLRTKLQFIFYLVTVQVSIFPTNFHLPCENFIYCFIVTIVQPQKKMRKMELGYFFSDNMGTYNTINNFLTLGSNVWRDLLVSPLFNDTIEDCGCDTVSCQ